MSDCMIIRRGGGGKGFDPNGAVLKVVTSTGCTVLVTGTGYSKTHQQADGYPRSGDADVTEHFFSIPASAFGTFTITVSKTYSGDTLTSSKNIAINEVGMLYEVLIGAPNIILNSTFGLQSGYTLPSGATYSESTKSISASTANGQLLSGVPRKPFTKFSCTATKSPYAQSGSNGSISLNLTTGMAICNLGPFTSLYAPQTITNNISAYSSDVANIWIGAIGVIYEIVLE